jgi:hypothetical protein
MRGSSNISSGLNELLAVLRLEAALGSGRRVLPEVVVDMVLSIFSVSPQGRCSGGPTTHWHKTRGNRYINGHVKVTLHLIFFGDAALTQAWSALVLAAELLYASSFFQNNSKSWSSCALSNPLVVYDASTSRLWSQTLLAIDC